MNPRGLYTTNNMMGAVAYQCGECDKIWRDLDGADTCCHPNQCNQCGKEVPKYRTVCRPCGRAMRIATARDNDEIRPLDEATFPLFVDDKMFADPCQLEDELAEWAHFGDPDDLPEYAKSHYADVFDPDPLSWIENELENHLSMLEAPHYFDAERSAWYEGAKKMLRPVIGLLKRRMPTIVVYQPTMPWVDITPLHPKD